MRGGNEAPPQRRIVVAGDSHAQQFLGALLPLAAHHGWQVTSMLKGACPLDADAVRAAWTNESACDFNTCCEMASR